MILSRLLSFILRALEVIIALVLSTASGWFLHIRHVHSVGPEGRLTFSLVIGIYSLVLSLIWLIPFTSTFLHYPLDFVTSFGYFTVFGILFEWMYNNGCGRIFQWNGEYHPGECIDWRVMEAFSLIGGVVWLVSGLLVSFFLFSSAFWGGRLAFEVCLC
jgi:uncharacterized membrane protein